ncbi:MAG: hypothetical protein WC068_12195 [Caulobacter sp.]
MPHPSIRSTLAVAALALGLLSPALASAQAAAPTAAFTDSAAAGLSGTRRVAISAVVVSFQASVAGERLGGSGMFADKSSARAVLALPDMDPALQARIANAAYQQLKAQLTAAGYEVVPEAEVKASAVYGEMVRLAGLPNYTRFGNSLGDMTLVSPSGLSPYLPYGLEGGLFEQPKSYIGWVSGMGGKSITPGGPSVTSIAGIWKLPGLEVKLAKALNANVVKAFYVVNIGEAFADRKRALGARIVTTGEGSASAQLSLVPEQTRIAFRTPTGNPKWQKVAFTKPAPAKDGDVVVRLASPMVSDGDFFSVTGTSRLGGIFAPGADFQFNFTASLDDSTGYGAAVDGMIASATASMVGLVKP